MKQKYISLRKPQDLVLNPECVGKIWGSHCPLGYQVLCGAQKTYPPHLHPFLRNFDWLGALEERAAELLGVMDIMETR